MSKAERLEYLRKIGQRHQDREGLQFGTLAATPTDVMEEVSDLDTFRQHQLETRRTSVED